jgi:hypothetical protein
MVRIALILGALFVVGLAGAFLLYVSVLSIFTAVVILIGLVESDSNFYQVAGRVPHVGHLERGN